jgi:hypothetical protein
MFGIRFSYSIFVSGRVDKMLALEELTRTLSPYRAKLVEMGDSL